MDTFSALLLAAFVVGYLVLAGADVGLGLLMPRVARSAGQRRSALAAIAPYFLASEVWLVAALGVLAGLFPSVEHHVVGRLWPALAALALAWLIRDAGLWLWRRVPSARWRAVWEGAVVAGSWGLALSWGLILAGLLTGVLWSGVVHRCARRQSSRSSPCGALRSGRTAWWPTTAGGQPMPVGSSRVPCPGGPWRRWC